MINYLACFKCWGGKAVLTYEENRVYKVSCECGCSYTFEHCSLKAAQEYHNKMLELYGEIDRNAKLKAENEQLSARIAAYEDTEEQGRLVVLPCKVGEACYAICQLNCEYADCPRQDMRGDCDNKCPDVIVEVKTESVLLADLIGVPLYSTLEAAEAALTANNDSTGG